MAHLREAGLVARQALTADAVEHREQECVDAAEVVEDERGTEASGGRDGAHRGIRVAGAGQGV